MLEHWGPVCGPALVDPEGQHPAPVGPLDQQVGWDQPDWQVLVESVLVEPVLVAGGRGLGRGLPPPRPPRLPPRLPPRPRCFFGDGV